jgi:hypothetical protein
MLERLSKSVALSSDMSPQLEASQTPAPKESATNWLSSLFSKGGGAPAKSKGGISSKPTLAKKMAPPPPAKTSDLMEQSMSFSKSRSSAPMKNARESELAGLRLNIGATKKKAARRLDPEQLRQQQQMEVEGVSLDIGGDDDEEEEEEENNADDATLRAGGSGGQEQKAAEAGVSVPAASAEQPAAVAADNTNMLIEDWDQKNMKPTATKRTPREAKGKEKMTYLDQGDEGGKDDDEEEDDDVEDQDLLNWDLDEDDDDDDADQGEATVASTGGSAESEDADLLALIGEEKERELIAFLQQAQTDL